MATLIPAFEPSVRCPSADFCLLTRYVAIQGATGVFTSCCLFYVSLLDSYPPNSRRICLVLLVNRVNLFRISLMTVLSLGKQISPDKNVSFLCTIPSADGARTFALRLPSDDFSRNRPCLRLILLVVSIIMDTLRFSYRGFSPHELTPMLGVHKSPQQGK